MRVWLWLLMVSIAVSPALPVRADIAVTGTSVSAAPMPMRAAPPVASKAEQGDGHFLFPWLPPAEGAEGDVDVAMLAEEVHVHLFSGFAWIDADFSLRAGPKGARGLIVGFPLDAPGFRTKPIRELSVRVGTDAEPVAVTLRRRSAGRPVHEDSASDDQRRLSHALGAHERWSTWSMDFEPGQQQTVRVQYSQELGASGSETSPLAHGAYVLTTGASWAGPIGHAIVEVHLHAGDRKSLKAYWGRTSAHPACATTLGQPPPEACPASRSLPLIEAGRAKIADGLRWEMRDIEPEENLGLQFVPASWSSTEPRKWRDPVAGGHWTPPMVAHRVRLERLRQVISTLVADAEAEPWPVGFERELVAYLESELYSDDDCVVEHADRTLGQIYAAPEWQGRSSAKPEPSALAKLWNWALEGDRRRHRPRRIAERLERCTEPASLWTPHPPGLRGRLLAPYRWAILGGAGLMALLSALGLGWLVRRRFS